MSDQSAIPQAPTAGDLSDLAQEWPFDASKEEVEAITVIVEEGLNAIRALDKMSVAEDPIKPKRSPGQTPSAAENKHGAWARKTHIQEQFSGTLSGRTVAIKDSIEVAQVPMRIGSQAVEDYVPGADATVVKRVLDAGATITGKAQCEDMCQGAQSFSSWPLPVRNPLDLDRSAGGSSSGCAALVAAGEVDMAIGGDSGGSIRIPASYCGVVGMKPTFGLVPFTGASSLEMTLEHLGPITKSVSDNAKLLQVLAGPDGCDPRQQFVGADDYSGELDTGVQQLRVGVPTQAFNRDASDPRIDTAVTSVIDKLAANGAKVNSVDLPCLLWGEGVHLIIYLIGMSRLFRAYGVGDNWKGLYSSSTVESMHAWLEGSDSVSSLMKTSLLAGHYLDSKTKGSLYAKAQNLRMTITNELDRVLESNDVLVMPTTLTLPPKFLNNDCSLLETLIGSVSAEANATVFNVSGHPVLSVPAASIDGLSVGVSICASNYAEKTLYRVGAEIERLYGERH